MKQIWIPEVINVCDLGEWLKSCDKHGIQYIPAHPIGSCWPGEVLVAAYDHDGPVENLRQLSSLVESTDFGTDILRWNLCAPYSVKYEMGIRGECPPDKRQDVLCFDDPRLINIIEDQSLFTMLTLYRRPWHEAMRHDGWPVEFRVFVKDHEIEGVSNYYPQVSLPDSYVALADKAAEFTGPLLNSAANFTADWLVLPDGEFIYLEGGPPHTPTGGAHMCCFRPGEIEGVALSDRNEETNA